MDFALKNKRIKKAVKLRYLSAAIVVALSGCATMPEIDQARDSFNDDRANYQKSIKEVWEKDIPAIRVVEHDALIIRSAPTRIPQDILDQGVDIEFSEAATLSDIGALLKRRDIYLAFDQESLREKAIVLFSFKGRLGDFIDTIANAYDISFEWRPGNIIMVSESGQYMVKVPNNTEIGESAKEVITGLGGRNVQYSDQNGLITYDANIRDNRRIEMMIKEISQNTALVSLQIAVVNVSTQRNRKTGFDWSQLQIKLGGVSLSGSSSAGGAVAGAIAAPGVGTGTTGTTGTTGVITTTVASGGSSSSNNFSDLQAETTLGGTGSVFNIAKSDFDLSAVIDFLSTYGETSTEQSVLLTTLSGKKVSINSGEKVPYVKEVGATTSGTSGTTTGSANTEEVDTGLKVSMQPFFDNKEKTVTITTDMKLNTLLGFIELSAGNQIGTITRPRLQNQEMKNLIKTNAGEAVIIGGLSFLNSSDNRNAPAFLDGYKAASLKKDVKYTSMFIVIRPTVTIYKYKDTD